MARDDENMEEPSAGRELWRRCCASDAPEDEAAWLLDLAAFAEGRLDDDERERVAALLARDPAAIADIAAARALAGGTGNPSAGGRVVAFPAPAGRRALPGLARWASLAAAVAFAGWLGFAMGSDTGLAFSQPGQAGGEGFLNDALDPGIGLWRDLGEGQRT
jgi:hypothetical protein